MNSNIAHRRKASDVNSHFAIKLSIALERVPNKSQIARAAGVVPQMLDDYVAGSTPKPSVLFKLAKALDVSLVWLMDDDADPTHPIAWRHSIADVPTCVLALELASRLGDNPQ